MAGLFEILNKITKLCVNQSMGRCTQSPFAAKQKRIAHKNRNVILFKVHIQSMQLQHACHGHNVWLKPALLSKTELQQISGVGLNPIQLPK